MKVPSVNRFNHKERIEVVEGGEVTLSGTILMVIARCVLHQTLDMKIVTDDNRFIRLKTIQKIGSAKFIRHRRA